MATGISRKQSDDGKTVVARIVNHGGVVQTAMIHLTGFTASSASAVSMTSMDLTAENTAADVDHVAPESLANVTVAASGAAVSVHIPPFSFTIVTMSS